VSSVFDRSVRLDLRIPSVVLACIVFAVPLVHAQQKPGVAEGSGPPSPSETLTVIPNNAPYYPITGTQRVQWASLQTFGPESLAAGGFSAAWGTAFDQPKEYGPHWSGLARRYGMRFTGVATSNVMEAGLGALWGEDPRYVRVAGRAFKSRLGNVFVMSFAARRRDGRLMPSYARYIAIPGNNFLSNAWRVSSDSTTSAALRRTATGMLGEIASNAWTEFWPDVSRLLFRRTGKSATTASAPRRNQRKRSSVELR
jgi:hypothetical protein